MPRDVARRSGPAPAISMIALALGAAAFGAVAVGVLAIGRLAVGRVAIKKARFEALEVDELTVRRLRVCPLHHERGARRAELPVQLVAPRTQGPRAVAGGTTHGRGALRSHA